MQGQFFVLGRKITDDRLIRETVGAKILHLVSAVIAFVQIHVQRPGIQDLLLAFPAVEGLGLRPHQLEKV